MKVAIVGGGVAGILSAVKLQSDGHEVTLLERHHKLAVEATSEQHGWGQFGHLYSHLEDDGVASACYENIRTLTQTFNLPGNNLIFETEDSKNPGELTAQNPDDPNTWYRQDLLKYSYKGQPDEVLKRVLERKWKMHTQGLENEVDLKQDLVYKPLNGQPVPITAEELLKAKKGIRAFRKLWAEKRPDSTTAKQLAEEDALGINHYTTLVSHDRPMRSINILNSAVTKFEELGGQIQLNTEITGHQSSEHGVELTDSNDRKQYFDKVVYTAGIGLEKLKSDTFQVNTVISPLLVVKPAISTQNFVKVTPDGKQTLNHICHVEPETGQSYSLIGNGDAVKPGDEAQIQMAKANIVQIAGNTFKELNDTQYSKEVYFGYKTEFQNKKDHEERNYHYSTASLDDHNNVIAAVPGKFTLAPSLAVKVSQMIENRPANQAGDNNKPTAPQSQQAAVSKHLHHQIVAGSVESPEFRKERNKLNIKTGYPSDAQVAENKEKQKSMKVSLNKAIGNAVNLQPALEEDESCEHDNMSRGFQVKT